MGRKRTGGPTATDKKSQSLKDQQFEEMRRIAERLIQALRDAGYACGLDDDRPELKRE